MPFGLPDDQQKLTYGGYLRVRELTALQELKSWARRWLREGARSPARSL